MQCHAMRLLATMIVVFLTGLLPAADWTQFRGKGGLGISDETGLPTKWSQSENIVWQSKMPGPGASSPITLDDRVFITCYSGYGLEPNEGDQKDLVRHLLCLNRRTGETIWQKKFQILLERDPMSAACKLRGLFAQPGIVRIIGAHNALGARLGERAGFDGIWAEAWRYRPPMACRMPIF